MAAYRNAGPFTMLSGEALEAFRLVKLSSATVVYADAGDDPIGITTEAVATATQVSIYPLQGGIQKVVCSKTIATDTALYTANDGKVSDAATGNQIGISVEAGTANLSVIPAIMFGLTSANGVFSGNFRDTITFADDFIGVNTEDGGTFSSTADKGIWLATVISAGAGDSLITIEDDAAGGVIKVLTAAQAADGVNAQVNGEAFKLAVGKPLQFAINLAIQDVSESLAFVGLAITDVTVNPDVTDRVGFQIETDGSIFAIAEKDSTETKTDTGTGLADTAAIANFPTTSKELMFTWDGVDTCKFFVEGVYTVSIATANIPSDEALTPTMAFNTTGASAEIMWVDYIDIQATR